MSAFSTLPVLFAAQCAFLFASARVAPSRLGFASAASYAAATVSSSLAIWGVVDAWLALDGAYSDRDFLSSLPGLWLPLVPYGVIGLLVMGLPYVRRGLQHIAAGVPVHWLVGIQGLRFVAIASPIGIAWGGFKVEPDIALIELSIGLTDIVFGFSALLLYRRVRAGRMAPDALAVWHATGILLIAVPGFFAIQAGLPELSQAPSAYLVPPPMFAFPTVLAPTLVVPAFVMLNLLGIFAATLQAHTVQPESRT